MATLPKTGTVTYEERLRQATIAGNRALKPKHFPAVQYDIAEIWPA